MIGERPGVQTEEIAKLFEWAKRIFFLGFGYAFENMEALGLPAAVDENKKVYGTAMNFTKKEVNQVRTFLQKNFTPGKHDDFRVNPVISEDKDCYRLLREYL